MIRSLLILFLGATTLLVHAQDTTQTSQRGLRAAVDFGLLENKSLLAIQQQFQQVGVDASDIGRFARTGVWSFVRDSPRGMSETRFLFAGSTTVVRPATSTAKRASFYGYGVGLMHTFKIVNTARFIVGPVLGYDLMWYRLRILPQNSQSLNLGNIVANPAAYNTTTFRQGFYMNLTGALSADYRTGWFKRFYNDFRIGARVGYQLPLLRSRAWSYGDGTVDGLPGFRSNTVFAQVGLTFIMKSNRK